MDDTTPLESIPPLDKSAEDIERDNQNRVNPPGAPTKGDESGAFAFAPYNTGTGTSPAGAGAATPNIPVFDETHAPENTDSAADPDERDR